VDLRLSAYPRSSVLLEDFNNDGGTDVFHDNDGEWAIVTSAGEYIRLQAALTPTLDGLVAADFNGDGDADIARTNGLYWEIASGGYNPFKRLRKAPNMGRGDEKAFIDRLPIGVFDEDHKADVIVYDRHYFAMSSASSAAKGSPKRWSRQDMR
jgi:hypothetical protein